MRVGVTGHRDLSAAHPEALRDRVRRALEAVSNGAHSALARAPAAYSAEPPLLRLESPLAEGADRLVADVALSLGYDLQCPLPFPVDEYRKDFADPSEFDALLAKASAVFELDGSRDEEQESYEAVGLLVLEQCDILLAIWDGDPSKPRGGTAHILEHALHNRVPCLHVDASPPHETRLFVDEIGGEFRSVPAERLAETVEDMMVPPFDEPGGDDLDLRETYFAERSRLNWLGRRFSLVWAVMVRLLTPKNDGPQEPAAPEPRIRELQAPFEPHFVWADRLSQLYAGLYRSDLVTSLALKALAVTCGLAVALAPTWPAWVQGWLLTQLGCVLAIVGIVYLGRWRRWQQKAIDYRLLAEQLRQMFHLAPLGRGLPFTRPPIHRAYGDPRGTWMTWHVRAIIRAAGLPALRLDPAYVAACRAHVRAAGIEAQVEYHERNARRVRLMHERLQRASIWLLLITVGTWALFYFGGRETTNVVFRALRMITIVLPGWAAVLTAIASAGEFGRVARRSDAMASHLKTLLQRLDEAESEERSGTLVSVTETLARWQIEENVDWRMVFQARPTKLPGGLVYSLPR